MIPPGKRHSVRLCATFVRTVSVPGRYGDGYGYGGHGLSLLVTPRKSGGLSKTWAQAISANGTKRPASASDLTPWLPTWRRATSSNARYAPLRTGTSRVRRPRCVGVDMGRRPLVRRRWRRGYGVSRPYGRDASLATATISSATTVSVSMQDAFSVPSCPANVPEVSRGRRPPCLMSMSPAIERHGASVPTRVHLPPQLRDTRVSRNCASAPGRRHPRAMSGAPAPDFHRLSGLPVCRDGSRPRRHRATPTWPLQ